MPQTHKLELTTDEANMMLTLMDQGVQQGLPGGLRASGIVASITGKMAALGQEPAVEQEEPKDG